MNKMMKKTMAAALALTIVSGGVPAIAGGISILKPSITASADLNRKYVYGTIDELLPKATFTLNETTGVLTIGNGWIRNNCGLAAYRNNPKVKKIQFAPYSGTGNANVESSNFSNKAYSYILAQDANSLFKDFKYVETIDMSNAYYFTDYFVNETQKFWETGIHYANASYMFAGCTNLKNVIFSNNTSFYVGKADYMFKDCESLTNVTLNKDLDVNSTEYMFQNCNSLTDINLEKMCFSSIQVGNKLSAKGMFKDLKKLKKVQFALEQQGDIIDMSDMFAGCENLELADIRCFASFGSSDYLTTTSGMFLNCKKLQEIKTVYVNASGSGLGSVVEKYNSGLIMHEGFFVAPELTDTSQMFEGCSSLTEFSFSQFFPKKLYKLSNMESMFSNCISLENVSFFLGKDSVGKDMTFPVSNISGMFYNCPNIESIDISSFDTSDVSSMNSLFSGCLRLKKIDFGNHFNTVNVTNMSNMFRGCSSLETLNLGKQFDTKNVSSMDLMFVDCKSLKELDLSTFDTSNVRAALAMFANCQKLKTIIVSDKWNMDKVTNGNQMFFGTYDLTGSWGTTYDDQHVDTSYARIDRGPNAPGYLTWDVKSSIEITKQPSDLSGVIGDKVKFVVEASGENITYQWQYNSGSGWVNSNVNGSKTNALTVGVTEGRNGLKYRCVITDANGYITESDAATLKANPKITKQPAAASGAVGDTAKFTVTATGAGLTYQWQYDNGSGWKDSGMTGANTATLSVPVTAARNGQKYRCVIKDANGTELISSAAALKVTTKITKQPADYSGPIGDTAKFTVTAAGAGLTYQWQYDNGSGWKTSNMSGSKTATLKAPVTEGRNGMKLRCVIKDANGKEVVSDAVVLTVNANASAITAQPVNATGCVGDTAKFKVTAAGSGLTYQWQYDNGSGWKDSGMTGAKTAELSVPVTEARNGQKYRCIIKDATGKQLTSDAAVLKVTSKITKQPASVSGAVGTTVKFQVTATGAGLTYQWQYDNGSGWKDSGMTGNKTATLSVPVTAARNGQKYRCIIKDANGKTLTTSAATLTVKK